MSKLSDLEAKLAKVEATIEKPFDPKRHKDETRAEIAFFVVKSFFALIAIVVIGGPIYNYYFVTDPAFAIPVVDYISTISATLGTTFGFVVGHYFKGSE